HSVRVSEELAWCDQPAELVAAQAGYVIDAAPFGLGEAVPTSDGCARRSDREAVLLLEVDRRSLDPGSVDRHLELGSHDQGTVRIAEPRAQAPGVDALVDTVDADAYVALLQRHA